MTSASGSSYPLHPMTLPLCFSSRLHSITPGNPEIAGDFVLYWRTAYRRRSYNLALAYAAFQASRLQKPLVILDPLRCDYPWACDRFHRFLLEAMEDTAKDLASRQKAGGLPWGVYYPFVETSQGEGKGLVAALSERACLVVTDDFPCFFHPRMLRAAAARLSSPLVVVDSNGLLPLRATERDHPTAHSFRRFLQKNLPGYLDRLPPEDPFVFRPPPPPPDLLSRSILERWPPSDLTSLLADPGFLSRLPIDHKVAPVSLCRGGETAARQALHSFLETGFSVYHERRNHPEEAVASGLSPYLHFGCLSTAEIVVAITAKEGWSRDALSSDTSGHREGWWGLSPPAEAFFDEVITWRELGFHFCHHREDYDRYDSLPAWAKTTLAEHAHDPRPFLYSIEEFDQGRTHDPLWNAAQGQLRKEGRIHNYLRMLWGKKILEWSPSPQEALAVLIELNNRYALDGRDPNSYSGIFWVLGRYDRAWGPERPIYGKIRYMSSENTARKVSVASYIRKYQA